MADDRMKNDDLRNMGTGGKGQGQGQGQDYGQGQGQQTPGRNPKGGQQGAGGQQGQQGGFGQQGQQGLDDEEEFGGGTTGQGGINRGGQNR